MKLYIWRYDSLMGCTTRGAAKSSMSFATPSSVDIIVSFLTFHL